MTVKAMNYGIKYLSTLLISLGLLACGGGSGEVNDSDGVNDSGGADKAAFLRVRSISTYVLSLEDNSGISGSQSPTENLDVIDIDVDYYDVNLIRSLLTEARRIGGEEWNYDENGNPSGTLIQGRHNARSTFSEAYQSRSFNYEFNQAGEFSNYKSINHHYSFLGTEYSYNSSNEIDTYTFLENRIVDSYFSTETLDENGDLIDSNIEGTYSYTHSEADELNSVEFLLFSNGSSTIYDYYYGSNSTLDYYTRNRSTDSRTATFHYTYYNDGLSHEVVSGTIDDTESYSPHYHVNQIFDLESKTLIAYGASLDEIASGNVHSLVVDLFNLETVSSCGSFHEVWSKTTPLSYIRYCFEFQ